ncbi:hypothetical protein TWF506_006830 [Arthrobotrys conoides]|uniref:DUF7908 domain-containing protein n=1 Tax=Arthrobotrys conoides TaxID=74498 RepID=A0AAN8NMN9_9PEZI
MIYPLFTSILVFNIFSLILASSNTDCTSRRPLGYVTPSHGAVPVPITVQGQPVTTYIPTAVARRADGAASVVRYLTSTYVWYSTYIPGPSNSKPQFISRGDQILTLAPKEPPKYEVRTTTITTTGTVRLGKKTYNVKRVPVKIEYTQEVSRSFGVCKAEDYIRWSQQNDERASKLASEKFIDEDRIGSGDIEASGHHGKHSPRQLIVDYVSCRDGVCTTQIQNWSVGYISQVKRSIIAAQFSGQCDGKKPYACELWADIRGHGRVTITASVHTPGLCTTSTQITTARTMTRTITRIRPAKTRSRTSTMKTNFKDASSQVMSASLASSSADSSSPSSSGSTRNTPLPLSGSSNPPSSRSKSNSRSQTIPSNSASASSSPSQIISTDSSSSSDSKTSSTTPTDSPETRPGSNASPFRIRIRSTAPTKRLTRRQSSNWYVGVMDNIMMVATSASEITTFLISGKQLRISNSGRALGLAFASSEDLGARGPIIIANKPAGPSTTFSIEKGTNRLLWVNKRFKKGTAEYCVDDDYEVNGVYSGEIDGLCDEVELIVGKWNLFHLILTRKFKAY